MIAKQLQIFHRDFEEPSRGIAFKLIKRAKMFPPDEIQIFCTLKNKRTFPHIQKVTSQRDDFYSKTSKRLNSMRQKKNPKQNSTISGQSCSLFQVLLPPS